jgi:hypothetical protein
MVTIRWCNLGYLQLEFFFYCSFFSLLFITFIAIGVTASGGASLSVSLLASMFATGSVGSGSAAGLLAFAGKCR